MACHPVRTALLWGVVACAAISSARAGDALPAPAANLKTITVTEYFEEKFATQRTCYRVECRRVEVDGFRFETVCEPRDRVVTVVRRLPVLTTEIRKVCCNVVCCEDRVVMKRCHEYKHVTKLVKKCVSKGHWECKTVCHRGLFDGLLRRCCDPCDTCCRTRTKKVWVHCPVYVECPVTCCVKVCVEKPVVCKVRVCKKVVKDVPVQVCRYRCVEEKCVQRCYERVCRKVPCKTVCYQRVCVPCQETVWCTRLVPRTRAVAVAESGCCPPCGHRCHGLRFRHHHGCCD